MPFSKIADYRVLPLLLVSLFVTACSVTPKLPPPPVALPEAVIPKLSNELKKAPEPSGAYLERVTQWRNLWRETLKTLQPKSGD